MTPADKPDQPHAGDAGREDDAAFVERMETRYAVQFTGEAAEAKLADEDFARLLDLARRAFAFGDADADADWEKYAEQWAADSDHPARPLMQHAFRAGHAANAGGTSDAVAAVERLPAEWWEPWLKCAFNVLVNEIVERRFGPNALPEDFDTAAEIAEKKCRFYASDGDTDPLPDPPPARSALLVVSINIEVDDNYVSHCRVTCGKGQSFDAVERGLEAARADIDAQIARRSICPANLSSAPTDPEPAQPERDAVIEALAFRLRSLVGYGRWQIDEGSSHHPTLPSAVAAAQELLREHGLDKMPALRTGAAR